jgi:hypothetical protein
MTRLIARNSYKYPLLIGLPEYYRKHVTNEKTLRLLTGFSVALIESLITTPIERTKIYLMTHKGDTLNRDFVQTVKS